MFNIFIPVAFVLETKTVTCVLECFLSIEKNTTQLRVSYGVLRRISDNHVLLGAVDNVFRIDSCVRPYRSSSSRITVSSTAT